MLAVLFGVVVGWLLCNLVRWTLLRTRWGHLLLREDRKVYAEAEAERMRAFLDGEFDVLPVDEPRGLLQAVPGDAGPRQQPFCWCDTPCAESQAQRTCESERDYRARIGAAVASRDDDGI